MADPSVKEKLAVQGLGRGSAGHAGAFRRHIEAEDRLKWTKSSRTPASSDEMNATDRNLRANGPSECSAPRMKGSAKAIHAAGGTVIDGLLRRLRSSQ